MSTTWSSGVKDICSLFACDIRKLSVWEITVDGTIREHCRAEGKMGASATN